MAPNVSLKKPCFFAIGGGSLTPPPMALITMISAMGGGPGGGVPCPWRSVVADPPIHGAILLTSNRVTFSPSAGAALFTHDQRHGRGSRAPSSGSFSCVSMSGRGPGTTRGTQGKARRGEPGLPGDPMAFPWVLLHSLGPSAMTLTQMRNCPMLILTLAFFLHEYWCFVSCNLPLALFPSIGAGLERTIVLCIESNFRRRFS